MKKNDIFNYTRKLIVRLGLAIIILSTLQETYRHYQIKQNFEAVHIIALNYSDNEEDTIMKKEEEKRIIISDTINVTITMIKLSVVIFILLLYEKKFNFKK